MNDRTATLSRHIDEITPYSYQHDIEHHELGDRLMAKAGLTPHVVARFERTTPTQWTLTVFELDEHGHRFIRDVGDDEAAKYEVTVNL